MSKATRRFRGITAILLVFSFICAAMFVYPLVSGAAPVSGQGSWTVNIASIDVAKQANVSQQYPDQDVEYTITVTNTGGADLYDVTIVDNMLGINGNDGSPGKIGILTAGQVITLAPSDPALTPFLTYHIPAGASLGTLNNEVSVMGYYQRYAPALVLSVTNGEEEADNYVTDSATASVEVVQKQGGGEQGQTQTRSIDIQKTVNPDSQLRGHDVSYTIKVTNTGNVPLYDVTVTDTMLGINHNLGVLAGGASAPDITKTYTIPDSAAYGSSIVNTAEVKGYYYNDYFEQYTTAPTGEGFVSDSAQASVYVKRPNTPYVSHTRNTPNTPNEPVRVPNEPTVTKPQPPVEQVQVPAEPVAASGQKGDLPKTGGNMMWLVLSGLGLASAGMTIRRRKR